MQEIVNETKQNKVWCDGFNAMLLIVNEICHFNPRTQLNRQNTTEGIGTCILEPKELYICNHLSPALLILVVIPSPSR